MANNEMMVMGGDASADVMTELSFSPQGGPFPPGNTNTVIGTIANNADEDWIAIDLTAGMLYTFTLTDNDDDEMTYLDTVLKLYDAKGGFIKQNDDIDGAKGNLHSSFQFVPEQDGTYYLSASVFAANLGSEVMDAEYKVTVLQETAGIPDPIEGTDGPDKLRGTDAGERITGKAGDDSLFGFGGNDTLNGGLGNDLLVGGMGGDTLNGGEGNDTISYNTSLEGVTINLTDGTARGGDADGDTIGDDIENVVGSGRDDMLTGDRGPNKLHGLAGNDTLDGDEGDDELSGGPGDDVLDGGDEDDTLEGGPGADTLTGGQGEDTVSYAGSMMGVEVRLHSNRVDGGDAKGDVFADTTTAQYVVKPDPDEDDTETVTETVPDFVNITGSGMADILAGDSRNNTIKGGGGDDMIFGGPGGTYDDSDNEDMLHGQGGNDKIFGGKGRDTLDGGHGNDTLVGGSGDDTLLGGPGSDMFYADRADTTINGHGGEAGTAAKAMADRDTLSYARFMDAMLEDGTGITLNLSDAAIDGNDPTTGVENIDSIIGTAEDDFIAGTADASETIEGGDGGDTLVGGDSDGTYDTVSYASSDRGVRVDLGDGTTDDAAGSDASRGHAGGDTISGFENVIGSAFDDDLTARSDDTNESTEAVGAQGSTLWGLDGDDTLEGLGGNDTLEGGAGADDLDGGLTRASANTVVDANPNTEINTLSYADSDAGVRVDLAAASASGGHADGDEIEVYELTLNPGEEDEREIDVATFVNVTGSAHNDHLAGDMFNNTLAGMGGDDSLRGGAGGDTLVGGPGGDMLDGGEDSGERNNMVPDPADDADPGDTVVASEDWAVYRGAMAGVTVDLNDGEGTAGEAEGDTLRNIELIWGSKHGDTFIAGPGHDVIHGDGGSDTVSYEASRHGVTVVLPTADDTGDTRQWTPADATATPPTPAMFDAAEDGEVALWRARGDANVTLRGTLVVQRDDDDTTTKSYAEGDVLASIENVTGSRDDDVINGDGVPNVLMGGSGDDQLVGAGEGDTLHGGEGNDTLGQRGAIDLDGDGTTDGAGEAAVTDDAGADTMHGGPGNDKLYGGGGDDTLNGGPGDDDLTGGGDDDTFVFTRDGLGSDVILDFSATIGDADTTNVDGDKIDLRAFDIDPGDLAGLLSERAGSVIVNLEAHGGGRITIRDATTDGVLLTDLRDADGNYHYHDANGADTDGVGDTGAGGVFIL